MKFTTTTIIAALGISSSSPASAAEPLLRGAHATFEEQAAVASSTSTLTTCEDPNCGGTAKEGEQCSKKIGFGVYCETGLYCIDADTCNLNYESDGAFCCPNGYQPNNQKQCILNSACTFGPPSPPTPTPPTSPRPSWAPVPAGTWSHGCPDGPWGGISYAGTDDGDAYGFSRTPAGANWSCQPVNNPPKQILQSNLDKFKSGGEFQSIMIGGTMTTVHKTFGHSLETAKQGCGECWIIKPIAPEGKCISFGNCNLKDPENPPVFLLMSVSELKTDTPHFPEISDSAFHDGLDAFENGDTQIEACNDLKDGKWSFEYQPYENVDLGCIAH